MNVRVITYDDGTGRHSELWAAVSKAASLVVAVPSSAGGFRLRRTPLAAARDMLAMCYARSSFGKGIEPLRNVVLDGIALAVVSQNGSKGIGIAALKQLMAQQLGLLPSEIDSPIEASVERLVRFGACARQEERLIATGAASDEIGPQTRVLAEEVLRRANLRERVQLPAAALTPVAQTLEDLLIARAWDLAAHFIQPRSGGLHGIEESLAEVLRSVQYPEGTDLVVVRRAITDLLVRPGSAEAGILADLGRLAFAVQLALGSARTNLAYKTTLPQKLYLDASVLMPAIVEGHPMHAVYWPVLQRLREQAMQTGGDAVVVAPMEFLNEVISHRHNALREVTTRGLEEPSRLERDVMLYGAENLNVFVGAYATHVGRVKRKLGFRDFLRRSAPYDTEDKLVSFLAERGIRTERLETDAIRDAMWDYYNPLKTSYEREEDLFGARVKEPVLIRHEAWQLARLAADHSDGIRSIFVTADARLRRSVASLWDGELPDALLSGVILVKLIDLLLGVKVDHRGLARLVWGVYAMDADGMLRRYFTDRGLQKRGEVEAMVLPDVVDKVTWEAVNTPEFADLRLEIDDTVERAKMAGFLDRFEDRFYEMLGAAVKRRERQLEEVASIKERPGPEQKRSSGRKKPKNKK